MITLIALLRLIPYGFVLLNAASKGYTWLTIFSLYVIGFVIFTALVPISPDLRAVLASVAALILVKHALDLPDRKA